jgi:hypothetical protein
MDTGIILGILAILLTIAVPLAAFIYRRRKLLNSIYDVKWKSTTKLKPKEVMGERGSPNTGFHDYYSERQFKMMRYYGAYYRKWKLNRTIGTNLCFSLRSSKFPRVVLALELRLALLWNPYPYYA